VEVFRISERLVLERSRRDNRACGQSWALAERKAYEKAKTRSQIAIHKKRLGEATLKTRRQTFVEGIMKLLFMKNMHISHNPSRKKDRKKETQELPCQASISEGGEVWGMSKHLKLVHRSTTDQFTYDLAFGQGQVSVKFVNGVFSDVTFPFRSTYTREQWKILSAIESEIAEIEKLLLGVSHD
jgi:hypothetical protein